MTGAETKGEGSEKNRGEGKGQIEWRIAYVAEIPSILQRRL